LQVGIKPEYRQTAVAHGNTAAAAADFLAYAQLARRGHAQLVEKVLRIGLTNLITRSQCVGIEQSVTMREQRFAIAAGEIKLFQFSEIASRLIRAELHHFTRDQRCSDHAENRDHH